MAKRTGMPALVSVAKEMCRLITKFEPIIRATTGNDPAVSAALTAAMTACGVLEEVLSEQIEPGT